MFSIFHKHKWRVVAFDTGYCTTHPEKDSKFYHHITFQRCDCGERRLVIDKDGTGSVGSAQSHKSIVQAKHRWIENNILQVTDEANVYDPDWKMTSPASNAVRFWEHKPMTGVENIMRTLKQDSEFQKLCKHQMVKDAFEQLETNIQLHEGIDTPE